MLNDSNSNGSERTTVGKKLKVPLLLTGMALCLFFFCVVAFMHTASSPVFPKEGATLHIKKGMPVSEIADEAQKSGIVRSSLLLYTILTYSYDPTRIFAGTYRFESPHTVFEVARKLARNDIDQTLKRLTIPEGVTRKDIAHIAKQQLPTFDEMEFLQLSKNNEGYLFPETYFVPENFSAQELVTLLTETFTVKLQPYHEAIQASPFTQYEVLILASIIEREANDEASMRMVSGILQNRLAIGMALQADASVGYILDKPLSELNASDLEIDTPYNTYLYPGLVPTPIGNPGLQSIDAVLNPTPSDYFYYITGDDGVFHYAETFEKHKQNVQNYLR